MPFRIAWIAPAALGFLALGCYLARFPEREPEPVPAPEPASTLAPPPNPAAPALDRNFAITNVTVIDVAAGVARPGLTVVVAGDRIAAVGPTATTLIPVGLPRADGTGKFLVPGFWDMHIHITDNETWPVLLRHGVTGVRHMFSLNIGVPDSKAERARGPVRPRIVAASHMLDGKESHIPFPFSVRVLKANKAAEAEERVRELKKHGDEFVKVYSMLPAEAYFAAVKEAKKQDLRVAGHVPYVLSVNQVSDAGQWTVEHLEGVDEACSPNEARYLAKLADFAAGKITDPHTGWKVALEAQESFDPQVAAATFARFVRNDTWHVPTLVQVRGLSILDDQEIPSKEAQKQLPLLVRFLWKREFLKDGVKLPNGRRFYSLQDLRDLKQFVEGEIKLVGLMHKAGVQILAGTDWPSPQVFPGESLHDELELFVRAGMTPAEALRTATINPAKCLNRETDLGSVETGHYADLVLLTADPLKDIRNTRTVDAVWVGGRRAER
jgi:imidazolonepropionase-like amidohydrolase